jgi:hypothetical protein
VKGAGKTTWQRLEHANTTELTPGIVLSAMLLLQKRLNGFATNTVKSN